MNPDFTAVAKTIADMVRQSYEIMECGHERYYLMQNGDCNVCKPRVIFG